MEKRLIAILRDVHPDHVEGIVKTLKKAGIHELELSLSNEEFGILSLKKALEIKDKNLRVGVGTVTNLIQVKKIHELGVDFVITPAFDKEIVSYCLEHDMEIIPGVFTPQDVMAALNLGVVTLKLFPADAYPISYIKSLNGPFPKAKFIGVGGVNLDNLDAYLKAGFVGVAPGSDLVKRGATLDDVEAIYEKACAYVKRCSHESMQ